MIPNPSVDDDIGTTNIFSQKPRLRQLAESVFAHTGRRRHWHEVLPGRSPAEDVNCCELRLGTSIRLRLDHRPDGDVLASAVRGD